MTKTIDEATADFEAARAAYLSALERDCERSEGSGAQERRNDEYLETLRHAEHDAEQALEAAKRRQQNDGDGSLAV